MRLQGEGEPDSILRVGINLCLEWGICTPPYLPPSEGRGSGEEDLRPGPLVLRMKVWVWPLDSGERTIFSMSMLQRPKRPPKAKMPQRKPLQSRLLKSPPKVRCPQGSASSPAPPPPRPSPHCCRLSLPLSYSCSHTGSERHSPSWLPDIPGWYLTLSNVSSNSCPVPKGCAHIYMPFIIPKSIQDHPDHNLLVHRWGI